MVPVWPASRMASTALAAASPAPTTTIPGVLLMWFSSAVVLLRSCSRAQAVEELGTGLRAVAERAAEGRRARRRACDVHATQRHAGVLGLDDDTDTLGIEVPVHPVGDLLRQTFLHLWP